MGPSAGNAVVTGANLFHARVVDQVMTFKT